MIDRELKRLLLNLPINIWEKVDLVLVMGGLKGGSEIVPDAREYDFEKGTAKVKRRLHKRIKNFLKKTGLLFRVIQRRLDVRVKQKGKREWIILKSKRPYFLFARNIETLDKMAYCFSGRVGHLDRKKHQMLGEIYNFPSEAVREYSRLMSKDMGRDFKWPEELEGVDDFNRKHGKEKWAAYASYVARVNRPEDYLTAKEWQKFVEEEVPELDVRFRKLRG